ncbi:MAG: ribonuclease P protein component [Syntrophorhabdaceae bacterium]|nr:ribonuclease P protein component [Syntrophorhabdales bacterium]MBP9560286.1 ribonuclease P protein component [Syntrophorhabdaceae bacterium]
MQLNTLKKEERLRKGNFRKRRWYKSSETEHFILLTEKTDHTIKRIGVIARKRLGRAVIRNRMRRIVKEFYRLNKTLFFENSDHLIRIKKIPQNAAWREIKSELQNLLENKQNY